MLAIVSPAKKLDFSALAKPLPHSLPEFTDQTQALVKSARRLSRPKLRKLMNLTAPLAALNHQRFQDHAPITSLDNGKQAAFAFAGDTYMGLNSASLDDGDLEFAQNHLRILSGLYGLLRPLDLIQPYRLEMSSRLATRRGADLNGFWGDRLAKAIDAEVADHPSPVVVNLASAEYFKAVRAKSHGAKALSARVVTPVFQEEKNGAARVIGFVAKRARGAMARHLITNRIEAPDELTSFTDGGYRYRGELSDGDTWVFTRRA